MIGVTTIKNNNANDNYGVELKVTTTVMMTTVCTSTNRPMKN